MEKSRQEIERLIAVEPDLQKLLELYKRLDELMLAEEKRNSKTTI